MNQYLKTYIELKKSFQESDNSKDSVIALYNFKEKLENTNDIEAKQVLVEVYSLLALKKDAYELMCQISSSVDKKMLKKLSILQEYAKKWGNHYAIPKPKTSKEEQDELDNILKLGLPFFKYHPNPIKTGAFRKTDKAVICNCCKEKTLIYYTGPFFSVKDIDCLCPKCIANGKAAIKFNGSFQDEYSTDKNVNDPLKIDELIHRTPGYCGWQQEYWRAHCNDYCAYIGSVGAKELKALGLLEEVLDDALWDDEHKDMIRHSINGGHIQCYLFKCLHCGKHLVWMDMD